MSCPKLTRENVILKTVVILALAIPLISATFVNFAIAADTPSPAALTKKGDAERGKKAYEICAACHLPSGAGRPDGLYPQLAGQHASVLIKQMNDIRTGLRDNPTMYPFVQDVSDPQVLADIAAHIEHLCIPANNDRYDGPDVALRITQGKQLYERQCIACHGKHGAGNQKKLYPAIAGQHYKYLLRQMTEIRDGRRRNTDPGMVKIIKAYTDEQLVAISAYQASLSMPDAMCGK